MVSAGPLLLLLMSTSLILSSLSAPPFSSHQDGRSLQKRDKTTKHILTAMEYTLKVGEALSPFIGLIPIAGEYINIVIDIAGKISPKNTPEDEIMPFLKVQFENLNAKIDRYHTQINWNHLTNVYQKYENDIKTAWKEFPAFQKSWKEHPRERQSQLNTFKESFGTQCMRSTTNLHTSLTSSQPSFNSDFGNSLIDFSRCHEKIIKGFTVLIAELFYAGNAISYFMYEKAEINKEHQLTKYAYESALVMFEIHNHCISKINKYVSQDVKDLIDVNKERGKLAKDIREFLDEAFDRYNWMAVAFITKNSQHSKLESWNKHILSDAFIREEKGDVTVAVAKQLKGTHSKAAQVQTAIKKCFKKEPECQEVIKQLGSCEETVESCEDAEKTPCKVKEAFTAVHAFIDKDHESSHTVDAKEAPEEYVEPENPSKIPYIYTGKCKKYKLFPGGHFRVLIKSDEELKKSPCDRLQCGEKGKCVVVENTSVPVCECEKGFYGEKCEENLEDYKDMLSGKKSLKAEKAQKG